MSRKVQSGFLYDQVKETIESEANHGWRLTQVIIPNKGKHSISGKKRLRLGAFFPWCYQDFLLSMTDNDWKFKQIVIPFDEKKGIYCTLGYEVIFERKK